MIRFRWVLFAASILVVGPAARSQPMPRRDVIDVPSIAEGMCVSNLFQTNMVLQRDKPIAIWGFAEPGERVTVRLGDDEASAETDEDRRWRVTLSPRSADATPNTLTVRGARSTITLDNVLIGDVWVLGGQSNMEFPIRQVENGALEIVSANFPQIRILTVPFEEGPETCAAFPRLHEWSDWFGTHFRKGDWDVCSPDTVREVSAIGYIFARRLHMASGVPIGVIDASRGGTTVETWTPLEILRSLDDPAVKEKLATWDARVAEWDPQADLAQRVARHREETERMTQEGRPIQGDREEPTDLRDGPIADPNYPGNGYAGMIGPLAGLAVKGAIFHQGYNNALDGTAGAALYRAVFPVMIETWRRAFDDPAMPFGILSLCTDGYPQTRVDYVENMLNAGIYIREAQYRTFLDLYEAGDTNVGFASTYDLRRRWYHPQLKIPAGERIARWALATQYGFEREIEWRPPMMREMDVIDGAIALRFDVEVGDPEDGAIQGFAIAGEDRRFQPADVAYAEVGQDDQGRPRLDRKQLVLTSPLVSAPLHYRYAWGRNPLANLQAAGFKDIPVATQRSDDWTMEEVPLGVLEGKESMPPRAQHNHIRQVLRQEDARRRLFEAERVVESRTTPPR